MLFFCSIYSKTIIGEYFFAKVSYHSHIMLRYSTRFCMLRAPLPNVLVPIILSGTAIIFSPI